MTFELEEVLDVIRAYESKMDSIMAENDVDSAMYDRANVRWHAANEIACKIYNDLCIHRLVKGKNND